MGLRYRKSIKIAPGVKLNLNKNSTSVSFGGKGFHKTISSTGKTTTTVGIPGTGISYSETKNRKKKAKSNETPAELPDLGPLTLDPDDSKKKSETKGAGCGCGCLTAIILCVLMLTMCVPDSVESINIRNVQSTMDINSSQTLDIQLEPDGASFDDLEVISSNTDILDGEIDTISEMLSIESYDSEGTATIYLQSDNDVKSNKVTITIVDNEKKERESREKAEQESKEQAAREESKRQAAATDPIQDAEEYVYVPQTGSKYHSNSSCSGMNNPRSIPLSEAKGRGFEPCKNCY